VRVVHQQHLAANDTISAIHSHFVTLAAM